MQLSVMDSLQAEEVKIEDAYRKRIAEITELAQKSPKAAADQEIAQIEARKEREAALAELQKKRNQIEETQTLKRMEEQLLDMRLSSRDRIVSKAEEEFEVKKWYYNELLRTEVIGEERYNELIDAASRQRTEDRKREAEEEKQKHAEVAQIRDELRIAGEQGLQKELDQIDLRYDREIEHVKALNLSLEEQQRLIEEINAARDREKDDVAAKAQTAVAKAESQKRLQIQQGEMAATASILGSMANTARLFGRQGFAAWKAFSIAQAVVAGALATVKALAEVPYPANIVAAAAAAAAAAVQIATIASAQPSGYAEGGYTGDGGKYEYAGPVHKGEFVIPADKTARYRPLLEAIHRGTELNFDVPDEARPMNLRAIDFPQSPSGAGVSSSKTEVAVGFFDDRQGLRQFLESNAGKQIILKHMRDGRIDLGFDT